MAFLFDDLLLLPLRGFTGICEKIRDLALEELEDNPEKLKRELLDLQMLFEKGEITEEKYKKKEDEILKRLGALRKRSKK